jgi:hypothetical protein
MMLTNDARSIVKQLVDTVLEAHDSGANEGASPPKKNLAKKMLQKVVARGKPIDWKKIAPPRSRRLLPAK